MMNAEKYRSEMQDGVRRAIEVMLTEHKDEVVYTVGIWTDVDARRSAISIDTFENSVEKCHEANVGRQRLKEYFLADRDSRRASLVPREMNRNNNPADFKFPRIAVIENLSLRDLSTPCWDEVGKVLKEVQEWALAEFTQLKLRDDAEIGISTRDSWYCCQRKLVDCRS